MILQIKVRKMAKIRNRYNQAPHLTQDTNGKVTISQLDITNESQEVSPFPAGDHRSKAVLLLWIFYVFVLSCVCYVFVRVCLYVLCGHLLEKRCPLGSRLWCLTVSLSFPIGILGPVWYFITSILDLCTLIFLHQ